MLVLRCDAGASKWLGGHGSVIGGAIAPLVFTALLGAFGSWVPIALYLAGCVAVTLVGLRLGRDPQPQEEEHVLTAAAHRPAAATS